jgi:hypothetical protein
VLAGTDISKVHRVFIFRVFDTSVTVYQSVQHNIPEDLSLEFKILLNTYGDEQ